jgi:uncharacterized membrane protein YhaH (DUF805 family)
MHGKLFYLIFPDISRHVLKIRECYSLPRNLFVCKEIAEIAWRNTQNELVAAQEKRDFSFNFNCFSQRKAGKVYIFKLEGNSILWFLRHVSKYLEIWDKTTYRAYVSCAATSSFCVFRHAISAISLHTKRFRDNDVVGWYNFIDRFDLTTRMETIEANNTTLPVIMISWDLLS